MSKDKLTGALDTLHWALSEYCEDHHREGLHAEKAWLLLLTETKSIVSRLIHPAGRHRCRCRPRIPRRP